MCVCVMIFEGERNITDICKLLDCRIRNVEIDNDEMGGDLQTTIVCGLRLQPIYRIHCTITLASAYFLKSANY